MRSSRSINGCRSVMRLPPHIGHRYASGLLMAAQATLGSTDDPRSAPARMSVGIAAAGRCISGGVGFIEGGVPRQVASRDSPTARASGLTNRCFAVGARRRFAMRANRFTWHANRLDSGRAGAAEWQRGSKSNESRPSGRFSFVRPRRTRQETRYTFGVGPGWLGARRGPVCPEMTTTTRPFPLGGSNSLCEGRASSA